MAHDKHDTGNSPGRNLPPIPTPAWIRWREFRVKVLPVIISALAFAAIFHLWSRMPPGGGLRGIGEGAVSIVASPQDGFLEQVMLPEHGRAEAGQVLLTVVPFDPRSDLDVFQSQLQISRLALEPSLADRTALDFERIRVEALRLKQELAMAQANLNRAEKVLPRHEALLKDQLIARDVYDLTLRDRDFYQAEVNEKSKALQDIEERLAVLRPAQSTPGTASAPSAAAIIPRLEEQMATVRTNWNPIAIVAPISGDVSFYRQAGEFVRLGEPILVINSARADRVIAYLKQPMPFEPQEGMPMEVVTRALKPQKFLTRISHVGARVEPITNAVAFVPVGALIDSGLPLVLPVPENARLRPGEIVDVIWNPQPDNAGFFRRLFGSAR